MDPQGLITLPSQNDPGTTMRKLQDVVKAKGMTIFAHIDHAAGAADAGMTLRPTDLLSLDRSATGFRANGRSDR
ncbi:hypothetical protein [Bradyrhizobium sp. SRS-191]|uniref:hypothetical protein n=1 Tax=Bradyrhizobium sp. SRS-191 TaxID=2962606 RepID=UPI00211E00D3|nr:hypothetical protein [Bradyrhizobium sp. SRS-191]